MSIVWELDLPPGEKLVLLALADQANDAGTHCFPSVGTIAKRSGQNERTVRRALRSLETKGHLTSHERRGTSTDYAVHPGHHAPPDKLPPRTKTTVTPDTTPPKPLEPISSEAKASSEKRARAPKLQVEIPDWVPADKLNHWLASRKAKVTPHVIELAIGELEKLRRDGHDPGKVLDQSTFRGWTGLFPIKEFQNGHARQSNPQYKPSAALALYQSSFEGDDADSRHDWPALPASLGH